MNYSFKLSEPSCFLRNTNNQIAPTTRACYTTWIVFQGLTFLFIYSLFSSLSLSLFYFFFLFLFFSFSPLFYLVWIFFFLFFFFFFFLSEQQWKWRDHRWISPGSADWIWECTSASPPTVCPPRSARESTSALTVSHSKPFISHASRIPKRLDIVLTGSIFSRSLKNLERIPIPSPPPLPL